LLSYPAEDRVIFKSTNTASPLNPKASAEQLDLARRSVGYWHRNTNLSIKELQVLADRHGMEAEDILQGFDNEVKSIWQLEAKHALKNTMCMGLRDFYLRRSPLFLAKQDHGLGLLPLIHKEFEKLYGEISSTAQKQEELLQKHMTLELGWKKDLVQN
ncbi:MAG: hypothetical protein KDD37_09970, partial [Bdellovibrionales bacterium]|nr:hypothetical protein [Bdellovibrionales bacterium]